MQVSKLGLARYLSTRTKRYCSCTWWRIESSDVEAGATTASIIVGGDRLVHRELLTHQTKQYHIRAREQSDRRDGALSGRGMIQVCWAPAPASSSRTPRRTFPRPSSFLSQPPGARKKSKRSHPWYPYYWSSVGPRPQSEKKNRKNRPVDPSRAAWGRRRRRRRSLLRYARGQIRRHL